MSWTEHLLSRCGRVADGLVLDGAAGLILQLLTRVDVDPEFASELWQGDPHRREGVLSWPVALDAVVGAGGQIEQARAAAWSLIDAGLVQLVGRQVADPRVPGAGALRMSFWGRVAVGLSPSPVPGDLVSGGEAAPWTVLHGRSQELLVRAALAELGQDAPVVVMEGTPSGNDLDHLLGRIAVTLLRGRVVVVGWWQGEARPPPVDKLLSRLPQSRGRAVLLVPDPSPIRRVALRTGAQLRWEEVSANGPQLSTRNQDSELTELLLESSQGGRRADVAGVPRSDVARPRRVNVPLDKVLLADRVAWRLELAMVHAKARTSREGLRSGSRPPGYRLLLSGLPGTGKSMAAAALATELGRPLVKLDLSNVLSKWLGETETLLGEVFDAAEASESVLLLDEADALLRQREGTGSSGMATSVAYLLSRLDDYEGTLVATTNRLDDLDEAFYRRFDDYLVLPLPDLSTRVRLWKAFLDAGDEGHCDVELLAERFSLSGGLIEGASLRARAWSQGLSRPLDTALVLASIGMELEKSGRSSREVLFGEYAADVRELLQGPGTVQ